MWGNTSYRAPLNGHSTTGAYQKVAVIYRSARFGTKHSAENIANFVDQAFVFQILVFNYSELLEKLSLFAGQ